MHVFQAVFCLVVLAVIAVCVYSGKGPDSPA
jgi:hypothetical protein